MGNLESTPSEEANVRNSSSPKKRSSRKNSSSNNNKQPGSTRKSSSAPADISTRAKETLDEGVRGFQANLSRLHKNLDDQDHPAAQLLDTLCSPYMSNNNKNHLHDPNNSFYSEDASDDDDDESRSGDETTMTEEYLEQRRRKSSARNNIKSQRPNGQSHSSNNNKRMDDRSVEASSYSVDDDEGDTQLLLEGSSAEDRRLSAAAAANYATASLSSADNANGSAGSAQHRKSNSIAKKCFFTKQGIGAHTQHYEGLTLAGNVVLMLAAAMKLKGCPTICDEDLRRVEQMYPQQFARLPDELLLSSGWRRISKFCHFSNKPIPDGVPFFRK
jgi:hypothetical protein